VFKTLSEQVDGQFAALSTLLRRDLTLFNRFLTRSRLAPIVE
jgi:hypothetical protein